MNDFSSYKYFLGANSFGGFYSLYDCLSGSEKANMLYILKGGPGCGKSTFMQKIAKRLEDAGLDVEYILCSGDPSSLDAIIIPALGVSYADGTAPHVIEPKHPAADGVYINLGEYYNINTLAPKSDEIFRVTHEYKNSYARAYAILSAAGKLPCFPLPEAAVISAKKRARGIIYREIPPKHGAGEITKRFLSAFCCDGFVSQFDSARSLCSRIYVLDNRFSLAPVMLVEFITALRGYDITLCLSPLRPDTVSHILVPELSLAFVSSDELFPYEGEAFRRLRLDSLYMRYAGRSAKSDIKSAERLRSMLLLAAQRALSQAKASHDELEKIYNPHVDFSSVYKLAGEHARARISQYASLGDCNISK